MPWYVTNRNAAHSSVAVAQSLDQRDAGGRCPCLAGREKHPQLAWQTWNLPIQGLRLGWLRGNFSHNKDDNMRDHSSPGALAQALPETVSTTPHRTAEQEKQPPARRRSREELAAAHQRAQARVRTEVQRQMDTERRVLVRKVQQRFHQKVLSRPAARPLRLPYRFAVPLVALLVFIFGGAWFEMSRGGEFLATGNAALRAATPWLVLAALPAWYWALCRAEVWAPRLYEDMPLGSCGAWW